jgi:hypothetical protein
MEDKSLGMRFLRNGFETQIGRPENENPPNEWYFLDIWQEKRRFKGLSLNIALEALPKDHAEAAIPSIISKDGFRSYQLEYSPQLSQKAEVIAELFSDLWFEMLTEPVTNIKQSMLIKGFSTQNSYGLCGFNVEVSQDIRDWIAVLTDKEVKAIKKCMMGAHKLVSPKWPADEYDFGMWVSGDRFGLSVPGNCACLGVDGMTDQTQGLNYELSPHNNDSFGQQMTLLAGIAYIWSAARNA